MTEEIEKQAEIYAKDKHCLYCKELRFCNGNKCSKYDDTVIDFIAGAKWGMKNAIEWHDLRETPNDLPKESGYYWCRTEYDDKFWKHRPCLFTKTDGIFNIDIIAWCELPQFKDKE